MTPYRWEPILIWSSCPRLPCNSKHISTKKQLTPSPGGNVFTCPFDKIANSLLSLSVSLLFGYQTGFLCSVLQLRQSAAQLRQARAFLTREYQCESAMSAPDHHLWPGPARGGEIHLHPWSHFDVPEQPGLGQAKVICSHVCLD